MELESKFYQEEDMTICWDSLGKIMVLLDSGLM